MESGNPKKTAVDLLDELSDDPSHQFKRLRDTLLFLSVKTAIVTAMASQDDVEFLLGLRNELTRLNLFPSERPDHFRNIIDDCLFSVNTAIKRLVQ